MSRFSVRLTETAKLDLLDIYHYVAAHDSKSQAEQLVTRLESLCNSLSEQPLRGHTPPELGRIVGVSSFREVHFKPYRVIYEPVESEVIVHAVMDGRRDLQSLLERRLTR